MYPYTGKSVFIDYNSAKFTVKYVNDHVLKFEGQWGEDKIVPQLVEYKIVTIATNVYMIYWFEQLTNTFVTQIQNLETNRVYSNILNLNTSTFTHLKGKLIILKESALNNKT